MGSWLNFTSVILLYPIISLSPLLCGTGLILLLRSLSITNTTKTVSYLLHYITAPKQLLLQTHWKRKRQNLVLLFRGKTLTFQLFQNWHGISYTAISNRRNLWQYGLIVKEFPISLRNLWQYDPTVSCWERTTRVELTQISLSNIQVKGAQPKDYQDNETNSKRQVWFVTHHILTHLFVWKLVRPLDHNHAESEYWRNETFTWFANLRTYQIFSWRIKSTAMAHNTPVRTTSYNSPLQQESESEVFRKDWMTIKKERLTSEETDLLSSFFPPGE